MDPISEVCSRMFEVRKERLFEAVDEFIPGVDQITKNVFHETLYDKRSQDWCYSLVRAKIRSFERDSEKDFVRFFEEMLNFRTFFALLFAKIQSWLNFVLMVITSLPLKTIGFHFISYLGIILLAIAIAWIIIKSACWILRKFIGVLRYYTSSLRGVKRMGTYGEAMRPGSMFRTGTTPSGQIKICAPGLLYSSHIGYGLRCGNTLVTPTHVISGFSEVELQYMTKNGCKRVAISTEGAISSKVINDVSYLSLEPQIWTTLCCGMIKRASVVPASISVSCTSLEGVSTGTLTKCDMMGYVIYSGSTLPGSSGSAYHLHGQVYGMHSGVMNQHNIGVSITAIYKELLRLFKGESKFQGETPIDVEDQVFTTARSAQKYWTAAEEDLWVDDAYAKMDFADADDLDKLWFKESRKVSAPSGDAVKIAQARKVLEGNTTIPIIRHSPAGEVEHVPIVQIGSEERLVNLAVVVVDLLADIKQLKKSVKDCEAITFPIEDRLTQLETQFKYHKDGFTTTTNVDKNQLDVREIEPKVREIEPKKVVEQLHQQKVQFPCNCGVVCRSAVRFVNHTQQCKSFVGESAIPHDSRKIVKMNPFLAKKIVSQQTNKRRSSNNSKYSAKKNHSPSLEESLSEMIQSQKNTYQLLNTLVKTMGGQSSAETQN